MRTIRLSRTPGEDTIIHMQRQAPIGASTSPTRAGTFASRAKAYVGLTKPRVIELLIITTVPAMVLAAHGIPDVATLVVTLVAGTLSAGSANVFNSVYDRDIDERMNRTRRRPMARAQVSQRNAYVFGVVLGVVSTLMFALGTTWLAAALSVCAILYYVFVYTVWLKRRTSQNIVWGGVAGCFPALIGWAAVTGSLAWPPFILFLVVFFWTPVHTWALGLRYREDYARVDVPMLPVVKDAPVVTRQMVAYAVATMAISLALWPAAALGWIYPACALAAGVWLIVDSLALDRRARAGLRDAALKPMRVFHTSNTYLAILALAASLDAVLLH